MTSQSDFVRSALRELQSRTEAAAKRHPKLRHMLVLPPGECIRIPSRPGCRPIGSNLKRRPATCRFGEAELVGPLPPRSSWPTGTEPLRAVVAGEDFLPFRPNAQKPYRIHLFFGGSDDAFKRLQALANNLDGLRSDITKALSRGHSTLLQNVFYTPGDCLHGVSTASLDSWLCTVHWWAWYWSDCPFRTKPQVVYARRTYQTHPHDDAVRSKLAFSIVDADVLAASAATISLILQFLDEPSLPSGLMDAALHSGGAQKKKPSPKLGDWNDLTDRQRNCMIALLELRAFDAEYRQSASSIAAKAEGPGARVSGFKEPLSKLVRRGLALSKTGREGGYWLTAQGQERLAAADSRLGSDAPPS